MIRLSTEYDPTGLLVRTMDDNGDGTGVETVYNADGTIASTIDLSGLPIFTWPALDSAGALATLLVVEGVLPIDDAANSQHTTQEHLIAEAEAWAVAAP